MKSSVHLQNYPERFFKADETLIKEMDIVREICSLTLSIRKKYNLRARLPLNKVTIIGEGSLDLEEYKKFIQEETNVKKIILDPNFGKDVTTKVSINFEKAGKKVGSAMPAIMKAVKEGAWKKLSNGSLVVADKILAPEDFETKLIPNFEGKNYESIGSDFLIVLDVEVTEELEFEGVARDFIRIIQNQRKVLNLDVSDKINLLYSGNERFEEILIKNSSFIKAQVLAESLTKARDDGSFVKCDLEDYTPHIKIIKI